MHYQKQSPWRIGPIPARLLERDGVKQYIANIEAPVTISDAVIKLWPDGERGPVFIIENRRESRDPENTNSDK